MIGYFDTSAIVPLVITEPSTSLCQALWRRCDERVSSLLAIVEGQAALAMALRLGRLTKSEHKIASKSFQALTDQLNLVNPTRKTVDRAADLALTESLRGYDAVHAATAEVLMAEGLVAISGDQSLLRAWANLGINTIDTNQAEPLIK